MSMDRGSGRRKIDREMGSYLRDIEESLLDAVLHESQLEEALLIRTTIGQAVGLLMAQEGLISDEAFERLVHVSQNSNMKLRDIAQRYVDAWEAKITGGGGE